jgi:hypothetical protein
MHVGMVINVVLQQMMADPKLAAAAHQLFYAVGSFRE